jgi:hypothetical protein
MSIEASLNAIQLQGALEGRTSEATLVPEIYGKFRTEMLTMLNSMDTGEKYKSPFFAQEVDPNSSAMPIVMNQTMSIYNQMIDHLFKSLENEKKWGDALANLF